MKRGRVIEEEEGSWHLGKRRRHSEDEMISRGRHALPFMRRDEKQEELISRQSSEMASVKSWSRRSTRNLELSGSEDETVRSRVRNVRRSPDEMVRRFPDENGTEGEREDKGFLEGELDRRRIGESENGRFRNILPSI